MPSLRFWRVARKRAAVAAADVRAAAEQAPPPLASRAATGQYGDDPLPDLDDDPLDRDRLAERVANILTAVARESDSAVVALIGPWGSGKTTLLNAVEKHLAERGCWRLANYNPWVYSTMETAAAGFFSELKSALPKGVMADGIRATLGRLGVRVAPFGALGGVIGVDATEGIRAIADAVGGDQSPEAMRAHAAEQLRNLDTPILVVLDDLDRLEPNELLLTFKLVRLLGRLPQVYYLLAYDEATLEDVLQRSSLVGPEPGRAREYLEKMVQVRLDIPPLLEAQQLALLNQGLDACLLRHGVQLDADATTRLQQAWSHCLVHYLSQPRAIKKLIAQVDAIWPEVQGEVDFVDFLLVTFLRTFERSTFDLVVRSRDELVGYGQFWQEKKETNQERWARWIEMLEKTAARHPSSLAILLSEMFLVLRSARENMTYGSHHAAGITKRRGMGSADFFDRYTQLGVPRADISDRVVSIALESLASGLVTPELHQLEEKLAQDPGMVTGRLRAHGTGLRLAGRQVLELLGQYYSGTIEEKSGLLGMRPEFSMVILSTELLDEMEPSAAVGQLRLLGLSSSGLQLAADTARRALLAEEGAGRHPWVVEAAPMICGLVGSHVRAAGLKPIGEYGRRVIRLLWNLRALEDEDAARKLAWEALAPSGTWALEDFLGLLVPIGTASNGRESWLSMGDLGAGDIDALLGVDRVLERLGDVVLADESASSSPEAEPGVELSLERRRSYALSVVRRLAEKRRADAAAAEA